MSLDSQGIYIGAPHHSKNVRHLNKHKTLAEIQKYQLLVMNTT